MGIRHATTILVSGLALAAALAIATAAGCVRSEATACGDRICPIGMACAQGTCVDQSFVLACARVAEGASCALPEIGLGVCENRMCRVGACGDGTVNPLENCDGANLNGKTCLDFGSTGKNGLACKADCSFDISKCTQVCGDGVKNTIEECDGTDFGTKTCITQGFYTGELVCMAGCKVNTGGCQGTCGDGARNGLEACDARDFGTDSCAARGYTGDALVPITCTPGCGIDSSSCTCGGELCPNTVLSNGKKGPKQKCVLVDNIATCVNP